jgi:membrane protein
MENEIGPVDAVHSLREPTGRSPSWVVLLNIVLVVASALGWQEWQEPTAPIPRAGNRAPAGVKGIAPRQSAAPAPRRRWPDILVRVYRGISDERLLLVAAGVTFYAVLALFPGIGAIVSIYGLFADPMTFTAHLDTLSGFTPSGGVDVLREQLTRLAHQDRASLGSAFALSLMIAMWSANAGTSALFQALTAVHKKAEERSLIEYYATTLAFTAGAVLIVLLSFAILIALPLVIDHIPDPGGTAVLLKVFRWPILLLIAATALSVVYRYGPSRGAVRWRWISCGSAVAAVAWLAASALFSWYVANFGSYNKTYLGAIFGFMTWIWLSLVIVLVGAKLDAELTRD